MVGLIYPFCKIILVIRRSMMPYTINPIGYVSKKENAVRLVILDEFWEATTHLELFSHIIVLWWIDRMDTEANRSILLANPPKNKGPIPSGVFACRSPARPNPIGHTIVRIAKLEKKTKSIYIDHMDADNNSPVIDIKPYLPSSDKVENAHVASWFENLEKRYF
jgi:tRNA-Thr(GGU) m(6)t(6)A37 methyltransferase TsaA